ncbi:TonB-dependent receptor [Bacteroides sp. 51]|uniref:SusC/RagA family TonB-linked outer membrane protein n=1 Tax=Bacteroides sp. 51 TaxID=2302938 RepID=UPI001EF337B1|nr:TonB-dependent receptor [Bacteroides sp. 51]
MRIFAMLLFLVSFVHYAQAQNKTIKGTVTDELGEAIIGASVVAGSNHGTITDFDGNFSLSVPANTKQLVITYIGYRTKTVDVTNETNLKVVLQEDSQKLDEVIVVGYGTQKKATLTGAVSAISNEQLTLTKTQDPKNMLTGKIPGVRVTQNTSEPGEFGKGNFDIRGYGGSPLIVVDGVPRGNFERIDANDIETISVLKDASAAVYGVRAANGVILITTKKGDKNGKAKVEYSMYYGIQTPSEVLKPVGAIDRMTLFNEKSMRNQTDPRLTYEDDQFAPYLNGEKTSTDWYKAVMAGSAPQQQHNVSISGGTDKVDYFVNFGYMDQKGFLKSDALDYNRYNIRSNINAQVTKDLKFSIKLAGTIDERERPYYDTWGIFKSLWRSIPSDEVYANGNPQYLAKPSGNIENPVGMMDSNMSGYKKNGNKLFQSTFEAEYSIPYVKGLKLKGLFSYDNTIADNTEWGLSYDEYTYSSVNDTYAPYTRQYPSKLQRYYGNNWSTLWQAALSYDNTFGAHHVSGLLLFEEGHSKGDNIQAIRNFSIPLPYLFAGDSDQQVGTNNADGLTETASQSYVGKFNYDYKGKYMAEVAFRYDGSSKFPSDGRWGFFPSASVGWRMSEEAFIKDNLTFVDNLKIRGSYGKMGDDSASEYQFVTGYNYPNTSGATQGNFPKGYVFDGKVANSLGFRAAPNPNITWYTVKTLNIGVDADMWHGLLGFTFEIFQRNRDGLLANRLSTIPGNFGSAMPQENLESDRTRGIEIELRHNNRIGSFTYYVNGNVSFTRTMNRYLEKSPASNSYASWQDRNNYNRYNDIWFGWGDGGRYTNYDQIANSQSKGKGNGENGSLPGDYIYEDWNGDGTIDDLDKHPIATTVGAKNTNIDDFQNKRNYPLMNYGITMGGAWKGIDFNMVFQGSAMSYVAYGEQLSQPLLWEGNALDLLMDRWRPVDPKQDPYDPSTKWISGYYAYGAKAPDANSTFMIQKGDYLRLKSAEIGYTLPKNWLRFAGVQNLRVYMNAYNLLTFTGVKGVDPEKPADQYGYMYPLNRSYNFGASITF